MSYKIKKKIQIAAFIIALFSSSFSFAQLGPSQPVILCNADASACGNSVSLGTVTSNQGTAGSQSWRQWLYEPTGGNAMDYYLDPNGKYNLRTFSLLQGPDYNSGAQQVITTTRIIDQLTGALTGHYGIDVYDDLLVRMSETSGDLNATCDCLGFMLFGFTPSPPTSIVTYHGNNENPIILDAHGAIHERLFDGSGNEFGVVGNPAYVVVNSITGSLPAGSAILGKFTTDQTTPGTTDLVHAAQNGTWTVQPGNTANTTAWLVTGTGGTFPVTNAGLTNIDVALSTRLKPADTLTGVTTVTSLTQMNGQAIAMGTGVRSAGTQRVTIATDDIVPVSQSGTWNIGTVTTLTGITNALPAGTNLLGKVGIDQTTPGTTNGVVPIFLRGAEQSATLTTAGNDFFTVDLQNYSYAVVEILGGTGVFQISAYSGSANPPGQSPNSATLFNSNQTAAITLANGVFYLYGTYRYAKLRLTDNTGGSAITVKATPMSGPIPSTNKVNATILNTNSSPVPVTAANGSGNLALEDGNLASIKTDVDKIPSQGGASAANSMPVVGSTLTLAATGQQAVTASAVALPSNTAREVCISSLQAGTQVVYFGVSGVTTSTGQELLQGGKECRPVANSNQIYVIAGSTGSTVAYEVYQ